MCDVVPNEGFNCCRNVLLTGATALALHMLPGRKLLVAGVALPTIAVVGGVRGFLSVEKENDAVAGGLVGTVHDLVVHTVDLAVFLGARHCLRTFFQARALAVTGLTLTAGYSALRVWAGTVNFKAYGATREMGASTDFTVGTIYESLAGLVDSGAENKNGRKKAKQVGTNLGRNLLVTGAFALALAKLPNHRLYVLGAALPTFALAGAARGWLIEDDPETVGMVALQDAVIHGLDVAAIVGTALALRAFPAATLAKRVALGTGMGVAAAWSVLRIYEAIDTGLDKNPDALGLRAMEKVCG